MAHAIDAERDAQHTANKIHYPTFHGFSGGAGFGSRPFLAAACGFGGIRSAFAMPRSKRSRAPGSSLGGLSVMSDLFPGPRRKLARGRKHIATVEAELAAAIGDHQRGAVAVLEGDRLSYRPVVGQDQIDEMATAVGDAAHSLRSALDLLASRVVQLSNGNPAGVHFPFANTELEMTQPPPGHLKPKGGMVKTKNFHRASPEAVKLLLSLKPWRGGNVMLRALHDLDLVDKHQDLLRISQMVLLPDVYIGGGMVSVRYDHDAWPADFRKPSVTLMFSDKFALADREVIPTLNQMADMVEDIIEAFGALFRAGD